MWNKIPTNNDSPGRRSVKPGRARTPELIRALETMMKGYEYQSDFAKKYVAQGRAEEAARAVLTVLRARGLAVPDAARERILSQKDPERLERWLEKAVVAAVLDEPS